VKPFILVAICMGSDLLSFAFVNAEGKYVELNPIMAHGFDGYGVWIVALLKIVATIAICLLVQRNKKSPEIRWGAAIFGSAFGLLGLYGNVRAWMG
jgi:membrane associated rhomboid family serine protease